MNEISLKLKAITYPMASAVVGIISALLAILVFHCTVVFAILLSVGFALVGSCVARVVVHMDSGDNSPFMFQVAIYHLAIAVGWFLFIFAEGWGLTSAGLAVTVAASMMCLFTRFLESDQGKVMAIMCKEEVEARYYPVGNVPGAPDDMARPVCQIDGVNYTIREAEANGFTAEAEEARKELRKVYAEAIANASKEDA